MKTARVAYAGAMHTAQPDERGLRLADGRVLAEDEVVWLPPFEVGTILALGLNYADHAKELAKELVTREGEPLVFLKGQGALIGHRGSTRRPAGVQLHALRVRAGRGDRPDARSSVKRADAYDFVAGYTVANDYAIRDYLENWYRPNLRVKNRDGLHRRSARGWSTRPTCPTRMALALRTTVNGKLTQQGNTARHDLRHALPDRIPQQLHDPAARRPDPDRHARRRGRRARPATRSSCEIEGIGGLVNTIVDDEPSDDRRTSHANPAPDRRQARRRPRLLRDRQPRHAGGAGRSRRRRRGRGECGGRRGQGGLPEMGRPAGHRTRQADAQARRPDRRPRARDRAAPKPTTPAR